MAAGSFLFFFSFENIGLQVGAISSSWPCTVLIPKPGAKLLAGAWGSLHPAQGQQLETMLFKDGLEIYFSYFCITHNSITIAAAVLAQEPPIHPPSTHKLHLQSHGSNESDEGDEGYESHESDESNEGHEGYEGYEGHESDESNEGHEGYEGHESDESHEGYEGEALRGLRKDEGGLRKDEGPAG